MHLPLLICDAIQVVGIVYINMQIYATTEVELSILLLSQKATHNYLR